MVEVGLTGADLADFKAVVAEDRAVVVADVKSLRA
jgi:hypothetical protein